MYVSNLTLENFGPIHVVKWAPKAERLSGWHVVLGNNSSGKSSLLRALSLAWVGGDAVSRWTPSIADWVKVGATRAEVVATFQQQHAVTHETLEDLRANPSDDASRSRFPDVVESRCVIAATGITVPQGGACFVDSYRGRFAAVGLGAGRRFVGEDAQAASAHNNDRLAARFVTLLVAGTSSNVCLEWLQALRFDELEAAERGDDSDVSSRQLAAVKKLLENIALDGGRLGLDRVDVRGVSFRDGAGSVVPDHALSDGLQSIIAIVVEIARVLSMAFPESEAWDRAGREGVLDLPIVVLIDEIDLHLHAMWQRQIGVELQKLFPSAQFIVTSHSPLVCQCDPRSIFRLEHGAGGVTGTLIEGEQRERIVNGTVATALATPAFSLHGGDRSAVAKEWAARLAKLNMKSLRSPLAPDEEEERQRLMRLLPDLAQSLVDAAE